MPINKSIADLPRSTDFGGSPPSENNFVAEAVAEKWYDKYLEDGRDTLARAMPEAGPYRGSFASKRCDRALWYGLNDVPYSNPHTLADAWTFGLGHTVHEMLQDVLGDLFEGAEAEVEVDLNAIGIPGSSRMDMVLDYKGKKTAVEIKSINGFGFKMASTTFHGPPEGPRSGAVIQSALAAKALGCDQIVIAYLSLEKVSTNLASSYSNSEAGRFAAEWHYTVAELDPIIEAETKRINAVVKATKPPPRRLIDQGIPQFAKITNPDSGDWVALEAPGSKVIADTGSTWMCAYCSHRDLCKQDGA